MNIRNTALAIKMNLLVGVAFKRPAINEEFAC